METVVFVFLWVPMVGDKKTTISDHHYSCNLWSWLCQETWGPNFFCAITYGPRKAVAEVSNHNEPIGRKSGIQLVRKSMDFTFNCFVLN